MTSQEIKAFNLLQIEHLKQINEEPTIQNVIDHGLDYGSMTFLKEFDNAYIVLYNEGTGLGGFVNIIYKDGKPMETIEIG